MSDDGSGLAPGAVRRCGDRGRRLDESVPGTGLGLAIVTDLAERDGGSLVPASSGPLGRLSATLRLRAARRAAADARGAVRGLSSGPPPPADEARSR